MDDIPGTQSIAKLQCRRGNHRFFAEQCLLLFNFIVFFLALGGAFRKSSFFIFFCVLEFLGGVIAKAVRQH